MKTRKSAARAGAGRTSTGKTARGRRARRLGPFGVRAVVLAGAIGVCGIGGFTGLSWLQRAVALGQAPPLAAGATAPAVARPEKVKITFATLPAGVKTELRWGKRKLGIVNPPKPASKKPFFIERPKDSGPLDLVARAEGFLPLNTRVYTYADNKVLLRLTAETDKHTILGYKQEIPDAGADGGAPGAAGGTDGGVLMPPPGIPAPGPVLGPPLPAPLQPAPAPGPTQP